MDHDVVVREKMTEKYLLDELNLQQKDEFEEHFFACTDCALDVRAGAAFVDQSKVILAQKPVETPMRFRPEEKRNWLSWLRPRFAVPVMALLLAVVAYQNLVTYPRMEQALHSPQLLPWVSVNVGTWGAGGPAITTSNGGGFLLFVRIPPEDGYSRYTAELLDPAGKSQWSLTMPVTPGQDRFPIQVPPGPTWNEGTYTLAVHGINSSGESKDVGRTSFDLHVLK